MVVLARSVRGPQAAKSTTKTAAARNSFNTGRLYERHRFRGSNAARGLSASHSVDILRYWERMMIEEGLYSEKPR